MNKKIIYIAIAVLVLIIGGAVAYVALKPKQAQDSATPTTSQETPTTQQPAPTSDEQPTQPATGTYANYDHAAVEATQGRKILFFHAAWCPQCRALEKSILDGTIPADTTIFKVNYDTSTELRQRYGVSLQTTLVEVDEEGNQIDALVAYDDPSLQAVINYFNL